MLTGSLDTIKVALGPEIWAGQKVGGISRYFNELALSLTREKIEIVLIVPNDYAGHFSLLNYRTFSVKRFRDFRRTKF